MLATESRSGSTISAGDEAPGRPVSSSDPRIHENHPGGDDILDQFLPAVSTWFRETLGEPTPPQRLGWPAIAAGQNTLIVAPTGSGKTLAAFLAAMDLLWRTPRREKGVRILYISPLKALNEDIRRNLELPLEGILEASRRLGSPLHPLQVAVRSGDTPARERARILRKPPDILITTPESLHLMLTSRARETLRSVSHVIVDEIHSVCGNKRGVFLALLLERLEAISASPFLRIGLSATQRPLDEVARYLGDCGPSATGPERRFEPRPVTIIDAGRRKDLDLQVLWPGPEEGSFLGPPGTIWPAIEERILSLAADHRSTIIFANNRRTVEKLTARLNDDPRCRRPIPAMRPEARTRMVPRPSRQPEPGRAAGHRGRAEGGKLKGVVATASLELGIDMGEVDLVCQVESPGNIARGLQRVGRAGHVVHGVSKGRMIAKTPADLLETAALARAMVAGRDRAPPRSPQLPRRPGPAGRGLRGDGSLERPRAVRPGPRRLSLRGSAGRGVRAGAPPGLGPVPDRVAARPPGADRLGPRPQSPGGSARLGPAGPGLRRHDPRHGPVPRLPGGRRPATGRAGRGIRVRAPGGRGLRAGQQHLANRGHRGPSRRGQAGRGAQRGDAVLARREARRERPSWARRSANSAARSPAGSTIPTLPGWLEEQCRLEPRAARQLIRHVARQQRVAGAVPDDRTIILETFRDPAGELGLAVLSPLGGKVHQGLKIALAGRIRQRLGIQASCLHGNDGLLIRLPQMDEPPLDLLDGLTGDEAERLIRLELPETALYGLRFRQNAGRALLMPRPDPAKRTPLWLQRLRAKDLLQVVGKFPDYPLVVETFRECLENDLDLPRLRSLLDAIQDGSVRLVTRQAEIASPFASELIFQFTPTFLYEWDEPRRGELRPGGPAVDEDLLDALLQAPDAEAAARAPGPLAGREPAAAAGPCAPHRRRDGRDAAHRSATSCPPSCSVPWNAGSTT